MSSKTTSGDDAQGQKDHDQSATVSTWKRDVFIALGAGIAAALMMAAATFAVGRVTGSEARILVEAILPTSRFLCSSIMTATATILALMLTLLGFTFSAEQNINKVFYARVKQIALYDMILLVVAVCFLVIQCVPITKSDEIPFWWYSGVYYGMLSISAALGGAIISIVLLLYATIRDVINVFGLRISHDLLAESEDDRPQDEKE